MGGGVGVGVGVGVGGGGGGGGVGCEQPYYFEIHGTIIETL